MTLASAAPGVIRRPIKHAYRAIGVATHRLRQWPDFLIIGAHRAGTTSLHAALERHPCVAPNFPRVQHIKGVRYFDEHFHRGPSWYRSHFATKAYRDWQSRRRGSPALAGEASPYYLFHPLAAQRIANLIPGVKLIVLLRNPIDRAYSHWRRERRDGIEPLGTFADAIAAEPERLRGEVERILADPRYYSYVHENASYLSQGLYYDSIRRWLRHFPRQQVFIESSEHFLRDPLAVYNRVLQFLGLPSHRPDPIDVLNTTPPASELAPGFRAELAGRIAPDVRRLEEYLEMTFDWEIAADIAREGSS